MKSTCIQHPTREPLLIIRQWQLDFCEGCHCAASLLSLFEYWHNLRLDLGEQARQANAAARKHGKPTIHEESLLQFHSDQQLQAGLLDLYGTKKIREARHLLVAKGAITEHPNPNPRYAFDKTLYFEFHPEVVNAWLEQRRHPPSATNTTPVAASQPTPTGETGLSGDDNNFFVTCGRNAERVGRNAERVGISADSYTETTYENSSETTTTPLPPSFKSETAQPPLREGSSSSQSDTKNQELLFEGPLANLTPDQRERARQMVKSLESRTAQQILDDWGQAIRNGSIRKSKWGWLHGVVQRAQNGAFTPTTDTEERRRAEKRIRDTEEASIRRVPTPPPQPLPPSESRRKERPAGLQTLIDTVFPKLNNKSAPS